MMRSFFAVSILGFGILSLACSEDGPGSGTGGAPGTGSVPGAGGFTGTGAVSGTGSVAGVGGGGPGAGGVGSGGAPGVGGNGAGGVGTGGAGTGGSGTGGIIDEGPEPTLVTSANGNYWQVAEAMPSTGAATITLGTAKQDWLGWGGTFNEAGWAALQALTAAEQAEVMQLLFSATDGIAFDWGRIPIGASDYAVDRYTLSSAAGQFDISRDEMRLIPYIKAAQAVKGDVRYWGSPWTPPPWAKKATSGTENPAPGNGGYDKGVFDPAFNQDYANYFVSWVQAYEMNEIHIDSVMAQNEPGWSQGYPTCAWGPAIDSTNNSQQVYWSEPVTLGPFIADFLKPALDAAGHGTKIWFGTLSNDATFDAYWNSLTDKSIVEGVALQWETIIRVPSMRQAGMVVMQSEHKCGNYPWLGTTAGSAEAADYNSFFPDYAPNNYNYGVESWGLIKDWINDGVSIYSAWNMVLDKGGFNLDQSRPWPQNALIWVDTAATPATYHVTPYYYVFRHVAQYVDPGAKVLTVDGDALAFQNPDGDKVIIIFNSGVSDAAHVVDMGGSLFDVTVPAGGWATVNIQGS